MEAQVLLEEAAKAEILEGGDMDLAEEKKLRETVVDLAATVRKLRERESVREAADVLKIYFTDEVRVGEAISERVTARLLSRTVPTVEATGELNKEALLKLAEAETKEEVAYIAKVSGGRIVTDMGTAGAPTLTEADKKAIKESEAQRASDLATIMGAKTERGMKIFEGGRAAFDPLYNAGRRADGSTHGTRAEEVA